MKSLSLSFSASAMRYIISDTFPISLFDYLLFSFSSNNLIIKNFFPNKNILWKNFKLLNVTIRNKFLSRNSTRNLLLLRTFYFAIIPVVVHVVSTYNKKKNSAKTENMHIRKILHERESCIVSDERKSDRERESRDVQRPRREKREARRRRTRSSRTRCFSRDERAERYK